MPRTTRTTRPPRDARARRPEPAEAGRLTSRILVATDGAESADGAIRIAAALAERDGGTVDVVCATPPTPTIPPMGGVAASAGIGGGYAPADDVFGAAQGAFVVAQLERLGHDDWPLHRVDGNPALAIAAVARRLRSTLVVMGIGRHRPIDRLLASEVSLQAIRQAPVPVLAVPGDATGAPRRAVVGVDFSLASEHALRAAAGVLGDAGTLRLLHVRPTFELPVPNQERWIELYEEGTLQSFAELTGSLSLPPDARVETAIVKGDPGRELLDDAAAELAELIAVGAQHHSLGERLLLGSVVAKAVRGATCAVLVTPPVRVGKRAPERREDATHEREEDRTARAREREPEARTTRRQPA